MELKSYRVGLQNENNVGQTMTIIAYRSALDMDIKFDGGTIVYNTSYAVFKKGGIKNLNYPSVYGIGYFGIGIYKAKINGKFTKEYSLWNGMIGRCYTEKVRIKQPTYRDVTVCEEWHNFQNFAKWFYENWKPWMDETWHLDKDILCLECKVYSPKTCCFVPQEINKIFKKPSMSGEYPVGIRKKHGKFITRTTVNGIRRQVGRYLTLEEAVCGYGIAKELWIKTIADEWKDKIDLKVYQAMYNYKVEITD